MSALALAPVTGRDYDPLAGQPYEHTGLAESLANYLASKKSAGRAAKTVSDKELYLSDLANTYPSKGPEDFTPFDLMHWEANQNVAPESLRTRRSHVRDFFNWCVRWDFVTRNPVDRLDELSLSRGRVYDIFTDAEREGMCGLPLIDGALCQIMLEAGLRLSECVGLQPRHVRGQPEPWGEIVILNGKGKKDRVVTIWGSLATTLGVLRIEAGLAETDFYWYRRVNQGRTIKRDRAIGQGSFYRWWKRVLLDAGVRYRNPHMTRHTFATRWLRDGGRLETLSKEMGHSSIKTTYDLYAHLDQRDVRDDMARMEGW